MLQRIVANWLRQQAQDAVRRGMHPDPDDGAAKSESVETEVVCVFATASESGGLVDKLSQVQTTKCHGFIERIGALDALRVAIVESGGPHEQLARIVRDTIVVHQPKWVVSSGFVFALEDSLRRGTMVVADRVIDQQEYSLATGTKMQPTSGVRVGTLLTAPTPPTSIAEKRTLADTKAVACESQAAVIAEVCRLMKTPMMAMHVVAEPMKTHAPAALTNLKSQTSWAGVVGATAGALLEQPSSLKSLWTDKEYTVRLSDRLAGFLVGILAQLAPKDQP